MIRQLIIASLWMGLAVLSAAATAHPGPHDSEPPVMDAVISSPQPGSKLRTAILDGLRAGIETDSKFKVHIMRVAAKDGKAIAFVDAERFPQAVSGGQWLLTRETAEADWALVWGIQGGSSDACVTIRDWITEAVKTAEFYRADTDRLIPELIKERADASKEADKDAALYCPGDIFMPAAG